MNKYEYEDLTIRIFDDKTYTANSADNKNKYKNQYFGDEGQYYPTSQHAIKICNAEQEVSSCIIIGSGGATGVHINSTLLDNELLLICCCNTVFCLTIPDLKLIWQTKADWATCFQIHKIEDDYIVHGELDISRLDKNGNIKWQFSGSDIFVTLDGEDSFILKSDHILLTDFCKKKYKINFGGQEIRR